MRRKVRRRSRSRSRSAAWASRGSPVGSAVSSSNASASASMTEPVSTRRARSRVARRRLDRLGPRVYFGRMRFYEYEAKTLFAKHGTPLLKGRVAKTAAEAKSIAGEIGGRVVL